MDISKSAPRIVTVAARISESSADRIDDAKGTMSTSAWIASVIDAALGPDHDSKPRRRASTDGPERIVPAVPDPTTVKVEVEEPPLVAGPPDTCDHSKSKHTTHSWGTTCECGKKIR